MIGSQDTTMRVEHAMIGHGMPRCAAEHATSDAGMPRSYGVMPRSRMRGVPRSPTEHATIRIAACRDSSRACHDRMQHATSRQSMPRSDRSMLSERSISVPWHGRAKYGRMSTVLTEVGEAICC